MILKNRRVVQGGGSKHQTAMGLIDTDQAHNVNWSLAFPKIRRRFSQRGLMSLEPVRAELLRVLEAIHFIIKVLNFVKDL